MKPLGATYHPAPRGPGFLVFRGLLAGLQDEVGDDLGSFVVQRGGDVAVDAEGDGDGAVAEAFLDDPRVDALLQSAEPFLDARDRASQKLDDARRDAYLERATREIEEMQRRGPQREDTGLGIG